MFSFRFLLLISLFYQQIHSQYLSSAEYLFGKKCYTKQTTLNYILLKNTNYTNLFNFDYKTIPKKYGNYSNYKISTSFLGSGGFSSVFKGYNLKQNQQLAIKSLKSDVSWRNVIREITILQKLEKVENIAHYVDLIRKPENQMNLLCLELAKGKTIDHEYVSLGKEEVMYYSYLLLDVLAKSHKLNIIHRDIKFNNIVIDRDLETLKLIDWGQAYPYLPNQFKNNKGGTVTYRAPEIIFQESYEIHITPAIDVWSAGICILRMLLGLNLFKGLDNLNLLLEQIKFFGYKEYFKLSALLNINIEEQVYQNIDYKHKTLHTYERLANYKNSYIDKQSIDLLQKLFTINPADRISAEEALNHPYFDSVREEIKEQQQEQKK